MNVYITMGRYSAEAMAGMTAKPEDRTAQIEALARAVGAKLLGYYVTLGDADFVIVMESEEDISHAMAALVVGSVSTGELKTLVGKHASEMPAIFEKAKTIAGGFRAAGAG